MSHDNRLCAGPPRRHHGSALPWVLLAISLGMNVFVAAFYVGYRYAGGASEPSNQHTEQQPRLGDLARFLDRDQRRRFRAAREELREAAVDLRARGRELREEFWKELGKPQPDPQRLERLLSSGGELRLELQRRALGKVLALLAELGPEQRNAFVEGLNNRTDFGLDPTFNRTYRSSLNPPPRGSANGESD